MIPDWKVYPRSQGHSTVYLKNVISVDKDDVQVGTYHLPFSRSRKKPFLQELSQFLEAGYDR